ncbi:D(2) dopamine receptor A [Lingula anatina]|uniref:D(2) dopamine receptor A n=1 Tax=Lingula anatina TaxID=7574 RepID=A0A1S3H0X7_LINAN|nr:D(2) dopamine receptor A [Lingula anatina]|eukprot:XP_013379587.1 D(2) dopamine receptor A [Lingula anatina]
MTKPGPDAKRLQKTKVDSQKQSVSENIPSKYSTEASTSDSKSTRFTARSEEVATEETQAKKVTNTVCEHEEDTNKLKKLNKNTPLMTKVYFECHLANSSKIEYIKDKSEENCEIIDDAKVINLEQESGTSTEQKNYNMKESTIQQDSSRIKNGSHLHCPSPVSIKTNASLDDKVGKGYLAKEHEKTSAWNWPDKPKQLASKGAKVLFLVTLVFALSWAPFWVIKFASMINPNFWPEKTFVDIAFKVLLMHAFYLNNAINPILYTLMNKAFATDVKDVVRKLRQRLQPEL